MKDSSGIEINTPLLIIAGPGTGKTYTLIKKIKEVLLFHSNESFGIIACTFTRKAADELLRRIYSDAEIDSTILLNKNLLIGTIHSVCFHLLKEHCGDKYSDFEILTEENQINFIYSKLSNLGFSSSEISGRRGWQSAENLASIFNLITDQEIDLNQFTFYDSEILNEYINLYPLYREILSYHKRFDFATIQETLYREIENNKLLEQIQSSFWYVFVDEYQDVNNLQDKLLKRLVKNHNRIIAVGDDDQSIYSFRGANVQNIINFPDYFNNNSFKCYIEKLEFNRRSTSNITNFNQKIISKSERGVTKTIRSYRNIEGDIPEILEFDTDVAEAKYIAESIKQIKENYGDNKEIAVLFRSLKGHSLQIQKELMKNNIGFNLFGAGNLFSSLLGQEFLSILDSYLSKEEKTRTLYDNIERLDEIYSYDLVQVYINKGYFDKLEAFYEKKTKYSSCLGLIYDLLDQIEFFDRYKEAGTNIGVITSIVMSFDEFNDYFNPYLLYSYLIYLASSQKVDFDESENKSKINLMTIHQAKGLEFDVVFLCSQVERSKNTTLIDKFLEQVDAKRTIDEERRIFYVGTTRAKDVLRITYSKKISGVKKQYSPLSFLLEQKEYIKQKPTDTKFAHLPILVRDDAETKGKIGLSYNRVKLFKICPLQYKFQNVWRLQTVRTGGMHYGINIHRILEIILRDIKNGGIVDEQKLRQIIIKNWSFQSFRGTDENRKYQDSAFKQLKMFLQTQMNSIDNGNIFSIEDTFHIALEESIVSGRFDLILRNSAGYEIVDFKTGDKDDYSDQLTFYSYCFSKKYVDEPTWLSIYYLKTGIKESIQVGDYNNVLDDIINVTNGIKNKIFNPNPDKHCGDCAYNKICIYAKGRGF